MSEVRVGDEHVRVERGLVGLVRADEATVKKAAAGLVLAGGATTVNQGGAALLATKGDLDVTAGGATIMLAGRDVHINAGGAQWVLARGDVSVTNGGGQLMAAAGDLSVRNGGAVLVAGRQVHVERGYVGVLASTSTTLGDGARVLFTPKLAAIAGGAAGIGVGLGVGAMLVRALAAMWRHGVPGESMRKGLHKLHSPRS